MDSSQVYVVSIDLPDLSAPHPACPINQLNAIPNSSTQDMDQVMNFVPMQRSFLPLRRGL
jgi:hypothetical protein